MSTMINEIDSHIEIIEKMRKKIVNYLHGHGFEVNESDEADRITPTRNYTINIQELKDLKMAVVMDRFTLDSFSPECNLLELTPDNWLEEINSFVPDLVFIESAWQGKDGLWYRKIANFSKEYFEMTSYCHLKNIPIVFWNKEDPVYTDTFMTAARMANFIFTTDIDCIQKYKTELGHDFVYHLHFAAQPQIHNPIEKFKRQDKFCFAGAYYHRYPKRAQTFDLFSEIFIKTKGFDIFDRNYKNARPEHAFPKNYNPYILGNLDPSEIDKAYKGYKYGVNMNSIDQSQTMFARRAFELLASNTIIMGNYSRGLKNYFGDLTICTEDTITLDQMLQKYCSNEAVSRKYRLAGLRKVLSEHLYEDRLNYIVQKIFARDLRRQLPEITIVAYAESKNAYDRILKNYDRQVYNNKKLILVTDLPVTAGRKDMRVLSTEQADELSAASIAPDESGYLAAFHSNDYYGKHYLLDLILTTRYGTFEAIGKAGYYCMSDNQIKLSAMFSTYTYVQSLYTRRTIIRPTILGEESLYNYSLAEHDIAGDDIFSVDEFNYCENCLEACPDVNDLDIPDQGLPVQAIFSIAEKVEPRSMGMNTMVIDARMIASLAVIDPNNTVTIGLSNGMATIQSRLADEQHQYFYLEKLFELYELTREGQIPVYFSGSGDLDLICVCTFYDANEKKISPCFPKLNSNSLLDIPDRARFIKFGFRPKGKGSCNIKNITVGMENSGYERGCFLSRSNVLVLSNIYPSHDALYRNMFVHKRMTSYKKEGYVFDVVSMNISASKLYREFEGINVFECQEKGLADVLADGTIDTVCVHFLDAHMWSVLKNFTNRIRIIVWLHGSEIQPWWRREYNYSTREELEQAKIQSEIRMNFWTEIFSNLDKYNIHFVFVSQYFANEVFEDYNVQLPNDSYSIIHNCIDTEMFAYETKNVEQRKKVLSIRTYASNKYANDLTVKCILELAKKDYFKELEFLLIGNGELFDTIVKPLKRFKNVTLQKTFLRQDEIAALQKQYGIFMCPTRWDSQGVSRDEAMSTGLVPITNAVSAIPEFVDSSSGILAPGEDYMAMAAGIDRLYWNPQYFLELSRNAAARVRAQSAAEFTIDRELNLINNYMSISIFGSCVSRALQGEVL